MRFVEVLLRIETFAKGAGYVERESVTYRERGGFVCWLCLIGTLSK
jgi:hypothetical protein